MSSFWMLFSTREHFTRVLYTVIFLQLTTHFRFEYERLNFWRIVNFPSYDPSNSSNVTETHGDESKTFQIPQELMVTERGLRVPRTCVRSLR